MTMTDDTRALLSSLGHPVTWITAAGVSTPDVPAMILDQPPSAEQAQGRPARLAQIRVSKLDVPAIGYRDTITEADGTVWTVFDVSRVINDRAAGTWRVMVSTGERGRF